MDATRTIPIVGIDLESDPVASGWVKSLNSPGRNLTGLFLDLPELGGKHIQLLKETVPRLTRLALLWDSAIGDVQFHATAAAGRSAGVAVESLPIQQGADVMAALDRVVLDEDTLSADSRAYRAAGVASDVIERIEPAPCSG